MYWTNWGSPALIEKASMDGNDHETIVDTALVFPNALTLDYETQILYWADAGLDKLESANTDGSNRTVVAQYTARLHPFGITVYANTLYWTDWGYNAIITVPLSNLSLATVIFDSNVRPFGVHVVSESRQPLG